MAGSRCDFKPSQWRPLARRLADQLRSDGALRSRQWWSAFADVPRHVFVPRFYAGPRSCRRLVSPNDDEQPHRWLEEVYRNEALVTRIDGCGGATSSSTEPSLMALMLEELSIEKHHRVLEIGTGTGYNAALLCSVVGASHVTTVDVDDDLVALATERLRRLRYRPTVVAGDGVAGYRLNSPFDRILATCSTWPVPSDWIEQLAVDGVLLCNVLNSLDGGLVRLRKTGAGCASGYFLPYPAYFMSMRGGGAEQPPVAELVRTVTQSADDVRNTVIPPDLGEDSFRLFASLHLQDVVWFGSPGAASVEEAPCLVGLSDGSWARTDVADGCARVAQRGIRRLWDIFERVHHQWVDLGRPRRDRYGVSIVPDKQWAWLDDPAGGRQWRLHVIAVDTNAAPPPGSV